MISSHSTRWRSQLCFTRMAQTCVVTLSLFSQSCSERGRPCGCVAGDVAVRGLERVAVRDWRQIDRSALEGDWPQAVPCEAANERGIEGVKEEIARCCETCEMCGAAAIDEGPTEVGLRAVDLWICPGAEESQRAALLALTQAVVGSKPTLKPNSAHQTDSRVIEGYTWTSNGELFMLRADAVRTDEEWMGNFQLGRCRSEAVADTWRVNGENIVRVIRAEVEGSSADDKVLWFEYVTTCVLEDRGCHATELDQLWTTLRSLADRQQVTAIQLVAETCVGSSVGFRLDLAADGRWKGGIWSPKGK